MWRVGDIEIQVDAEGKFFAEVDGKVIKRASLAVLTTLLERGKKAVPVLIPDQGYSRWHVKKDEIARVVSKDRLKGKKSGTSYHSYDLVYLYDPKALGELEKLLEEYKKLRERWDKVLDTMTRVTASNLNDLRNRESEEG